MKKEQSTKNTVWKLSDALSAVFAQYEREFRSRRIKTGKVAKRARGKVVRGTSKV